MGKARSTSSFEVRSRREAKELRGTANMNASQIASPFSNTPTGENVVLKSLAEKGGILTGALAFKDSILGIVSGAVNLGNTTTGYSSFILLQAETGTADDLTDLQNPTHPGQIVYLQADTGDTITIKTTGNMTTFNGSDFTLSATKVSQFIFTIETGKWEQVNQGSGGVTFPITPTILDNGAGWTSPVAIDLALVTGHVTKFTLDAALTLTFSNPPASGTQIEFEIEFVQDATGGFAVTFPATVQETITIATTALATSIVTLRTNDGGTTYHAITTLAGSISGGGGGISDIIEDVTPQLGGALDGQGFDLNNLGVAFMTEQAAAEVDVAGKGQLWVKSGAPNTLQYTDENGTDFTIGGAGGFLTDIVGDTTPTLGGDLVADVWDIFMGGRSLFIDLDADTKFQAGTDDILKVTVGAVNTVDFLVDSVLMQGAIFLDMNGNDIILDVDNDSKFNMTGDDAMSIEMGAVAVADFTATSIGFNVGLAMGSNGISQIDTLIMATTGASTASNPEIFSNGTSMFINVPTGDSMLFTTNAINHFQMSTLSSGAFSTNVNAELFLKRLDTTPTDTDILGKIAFYGNNSAAEDDTLYGYIQVKSNDVTDATEDGQMELHIISAGADLEMMRFEPGGNWIYKTAGGDADLQMVSDQSVAATFATIRFEQDNSSGTQTEFSGIRTDGVTTTAGSEVGSLRLLVVSNGSLGAFLEAEGTAGGLTKIGFHNTTPFAKPTISSARDNPEGALKDLLAHLASYGLIIDSSTVS